MAELVLDRTQFRTALRIEVQSSIVDVQFGTPQKSWLPVTCGGRPSWAMGSVRTLSGREVEFARRLFPTATHVVEIPYLSFLTMRHRFVVVQNERTLEIGHLNNVEMRNIKHICLCEEVVAVGRR
jgi:head-tail adaptor